MAHPTDKQAETIFHALHSLDRLMGKQDTTTQARPGFTQLYAYAHDPAYAPSSNLLLALSHDLRLRRDFNRLISKQALAAFPRAAAASTGDIQQREEDGFRLTLKPSRADPAQVYLIIESIDRDESPHLMFVQTEEEPVYRLVLEEFQDGEAQILLNEQEDIVKALRNFKSDVILR